MVLITGHRRENFGDGMLHICQAINTLAHRFEDVDFVYPIHLNPNIQRAVHDTIDIALPNVFLLAPSLYLPYTHLTPPIPQREVDMSGKPLRNTALRLQKVGCDMARRGRKRVKDVLKKGLDTF